MSEGGRDDNETVQFGYDPADMVDVLMQVHGMRTWDHGPRLRVAAKVALPTFVLVVVMRAFAEAPMAGATASDWLLAAVVGAGAGLLAHLWWPIGAARALRRDVEGRWQPPGEHTCTVTRDAEGLRCEQPGLSLEIPFDEMLDVELRGADLDVWSHDGGLINIRARAFDDAAHRDRFAAALRRGMASAGQQPARDDER
ncbi:MAG: hypothetical protein KAI24_24775 [Planctomycetes bacterium]|nr:hypothetical protein [Planctomycetota bacterium]